MNAARIEPVKIALVGCGRIAQTWLEALKTMPEYRLKGVADTDADVVKKVADQYETKGFGDHRQLLEAESLDGVIICTPPSTHTDIAGLFLDNGVHVLCEKPLAVSSREAGILVDKAITTNRVLMMASKFRYVDAVIKAKSIVDSGALGDVILYENVFCSKVDMRDRWNADRNLSGGGVLIDNGTHSVDIARYLLGPISMVQASEGRRVQGFGVEDTCRLELRAASGAMGAVDLSWSIHKERDAYIEVFGSRGVLSIGWKGAKYRQDEKADWVNLGEAYNKVAAFVSQLRNFAGSIRGTEAPRITTEDSLQSVRVVEAAYRSMEMDKWVMVAAAGLAA